MSLVHYNDEDAIVGKLLLIARLVNRSPLIIGSGRADTADIELVKMPNGQAYLPGSSLAGKLKVLFRTKTKIADQLLEYFWGSPNNNKKRKQYYQSHICIDDAFTQNSIPYMAIKDGVKIRATTQTADEGAKYEYEVVEPGVEFIFRAEVTIRRRMVDQLGMLEKMTDMIGRLLSEDFRIGAFTQTGFGRMECQDWELRSFAFPVQAKAWLAYLDGRKRQGRLLRFEEAERLELAVGRRLCLQAQFRLHRALITSSYGVEASQPDKTQAFRQRKGKEELVVSGKSLRGAIRHRALRILHTLWGTNSAEPYINALFGYVDEEQGKAQRSRLRIDEAILQGTQKQLQTRIKVDRFSGDTIEGALMETEPVWASSGTSNLQLKLQIEDHEDYEVTLLLLLLKDLWLADLPIGGEKNIGRGALEGMEAELVIWNDAEKTKVKIRLRGSLAGIEILEGQALVERYNYFPKTPPNA